MSINFKFNHGVGVFFFVDSGQELGPSTIFEEIKTSQNKKLSFS